MCKTGEEHKDIKIQQEMKEEKKIKRNEVKTEIEGVKKKENPKNNLKN